MLAGGKLFGLRTRSWLAGGASLLALPILADTWQLSEWRRDLQSAVDISTTVAVREMMAGGDPGRRARRAIRFFAATPGAATDVQYPPRTGRYAGSPRAVRASATIRRSPFFSSKVGLSYTLSAESTSALLRTGPECPSWREMRVE